MKFLSHFSFIKHSHLTKIQSFFESDISSAEKTEFTVLKKEDRFRSPEAVSKLCTTRIPQNGLDFRNGVVTPHLLFVQLANTLDIHQLIILGCLLCACQKTPWTQTHVRKADLLDFAIAAKHTHGRKKALRALNYVEERAVSIMEVFVHLYLGLPNHLGGLGLKGGIFNYKVELDDAGKMALNQKHCYIDYCFPEQKIAYEYQGSHHNYLVDYDSSRFAALKDLGYKITTITKSQLYNPLRRQQLLNQILLMHNKKLRVRTNKFATAHQRICDLLPRYPGDVHPSHIADIGSSDKQPYYAKQAQTYF